MKTSLPLTGEEMEKAVNAMDLNRTTATDTLISLCNRADNSGKATSISTGSAEASRLLTPLRMYGLEKAGKHLERCLYFEDGELIVTPFGVTSKVQKQTKAVAA